MAKGCDSSWDFDYKSRVDALVDEGYAFIGRYLNHSEGVRNGLTKSEAERLSDAGIFIVALYEADSGTSISHFTRANGIADAKDAIALAEDLGMPTGNPIYFCIDTDVKKSQMSTNIDEYVLKDGGAIQTMTSIFYIVNESISILENAIRTGLPVPEKLKSIIRSLGKSEESSEISDEKEGKWQHLFNKSG